MIDKNIAVGRLALTISIHADKVFGQGGEIVSFDGMYVGVTVNGSVHRTTPSGIAIVCDTPDEMSRLNMCDDETYKKIKELKEARRKFIVGQ